MQAHLAKALCIEAAHRNPEGGARQQRLHGHSYRIELLAEGPVNPDLGWVVDYAEVKRLFKPLQDQLDHAYLNELPGLEHHATVKDLERWIMARLDHAPAWFKGVKITILGDLAFRPRALDPDLSLGLPERIRFTFEAAQSLPQLPEGHPCRRMHGHSYIVEAAAAPFHRLETELHDIYEELDHRCLNDLPGLDHATCERICHWFWERLRRAGFEPAAVQVQETPNARCVYFGR